MTSGGLEHELPRSHDAPWLARRVLGEWFGASLASDELHRAKLLASELVTNAVLHGAGRIRLQAQLEGRRLRVEVSDEGTGFDRAGGPRSLDHLRGQGLAIIEAESSRWGIEPGASRVWFELATR